MRTILLLVTFFVFCFLIRTSTSSELQVFRGKTPPGWQVIERAEPAAPLKLVFAVKQKNLDLLKTILYEVSDPNHHKYGQHLTLDAVDELTANPEGTKIVEDFLLSSSSSSSSHGISSDNIIKTRNGGFITVQLTVGTAENLLRAEFMNFQHFPSRKTTTKTNVFSLPSAVAEQLDFVTANCLFPTVRPVSIVAHHNENNNFPVFNASNPLANGFVTPQLLYTFYGISNPVVATASSTQSVFETDGQSFDTNDLATFQKTFNIPNNPVSKVIGPNTPNTCSDPNNCAEALLDVEYIMAVAQKSPTTFWSIASSDQNPFLDWIIAVGNDISAPLVHSVSYGGVEPYDDPSNDQRFDSEIQKLGARGITVVISSGDDGVANFLARNDSSQCGFNPSFPATSPHVTAIGATQGPEDGKTEIACSSKTGGLITTGGGFSYNFARPSFQEKAVQNYMKTAKLPPASMYNTNGRGYPDVAMMGHNYNVIIGGKTLTVSGTSASAPVFGGVVTLVNGLRMKNNKAPLGFLNLALYNLAETTPSAFRDITSGENNCCATGTVCCQYGFFASSGWDPLTGLGSIDFAKFSEALVNL